MRPALFVQRPSAAHPTCARAFTFSHTQTGNRQPGALPVALTCAAEPVYEQARSGPILVVEDDKAVQTMLLMALEDASYEVELARNGAEALSKLATLRPRLILLDMRMPIMDGPTFLHELYRRPPYTIPPVIIMTAYREVDPAALAFGLPWISKPMNIELLLRLIEQYTTSK